MPGETFGNAVRAYALAYGYDLNDDSKYKTAKANAHALLKDSRVSNCIRELMSEYELTREIVDRELNYVILQNENLPAKMQAISLFYKVFGKAAVDDSESSMLTDRALELAKNTIVNFRFCLEKYA